MMAVRKLHVSKVACHPNQVVAWQKSGLPDDALCIENAVIYQVSRRARSDSQPHSSAITMSCNTVDGGFCRDTTVSRLLWILRDRRQTSS